MISNKTYSDVWASMDACNSSGVIHALHRWIDEVWEEARELKRGTDYVNSHPIVVIVADKLLQLAEIASHATDREVMISNAMERSKESGKPVE
jgi:hypothetical protein